MNVRVYIFIAGMGVASLSFSAGFHIGSAPSAVVPPDVCADEQCLCDDSDEVAVAIARDVAGSDCSDFRRRLSMDGFGHTATRHGVEIVIHCGRPELSLLHVDGDIRIQTTCYVDDICRAIERAKANAIAKAWAGEP